LLRLILGDLEYLAQLLEAARQPVALRLVHGAILLPDGHRAALRLEHGEIEFSVVRNNLIGGLNRFLYPKASTWIPVMNPCTVIVDRYTDHRNFTILEVLEHPDGQEIQRAAARLNVQEKVH